MGGGLIVAIGAQNAFVLTQGVRRNHHLAVALLCIACDVVLIGLGVTGVGAAVASNPALGSVAAWGGAAFLSWYGLGAFRSAWRGGSMAAEGDPGAAAGDALGRTLLLTLAVTLLNPHVYLDTLLLMGSIAGRFGSPGRYWFGLGAMTASAAWFLALSLGGQLLAPAFRRQVTWRILDFLVGLTMCAIAASLIRSAFNG